MKSSKGKTKDAFNNIKYLPVFLALAAVAHAAPPTEVVPDQASLPPGVVPDAENASYVADFGEEGLGDIRSVVLETKVYLDNKKVDEKNPDFISGGSTKKTDKVGAKLKEIINSLTDHEMVEVVISFTDKVKVPRFAGFNFDKGADAAQNKRALEFNQGVIEKVKKLRSARYKSIKQDISGKFGGDVLNEYWLSQGVLAKIPVASIRALSQQPDVISVVANHGNAGPGGIRPYDGQVRINSDRWYWHIINNNLYQSTNGRVAFIDSGANFNHTLTKYRVAAYDCQSGQNCNGWDTSDETGHGAAVASIIGGNWNLGSDYHGVTYFYMDSYKVGDSSWCVDCINRAFEAIPLRSTIAVNMSGGSWNVGENDILSINADNLVSSSNIPFMACAGNSQQDANVTQKVWAPGNAHQVIGVGAVHVDTWELEGYSSRGWVGSRFKPEVTAPTATEGAAHDHNSNLRSFNGCSGATPYVTGLAAMYKKYFSQFGIYDAGHVYASVIASGSNSKASTAYDTTEGAGRIYAFPAGRSHWGKRTIASTGSTTDIKIYIDSNRKNIDVAIWWPEKQGESHNDIDVYLLRPNGTECARGYSSGNVYEKLNCDASNLASGYYTLRIKGYSVRKSYQQVYWYLAQG